MVAEMNNMSLLESIMRSRENKLPRLLVYGQEGTGKPTFTTGTPSPVFVQTEDEYHLDRQCNSN